MSLYEYDPFWDERKEYIEHEEVTWHMGYEDGYSKGFKDGCKKSKQIAILEHEVENLQNLLNSQLRLLNKHENKTPE